MVEPDAGCAFALDADEALAPLVEEAARRWSLATGCEVHIAPGQAAAAFRLVPSVVRPDGSQAPGVTNEARTLAEINAKTGAAQRARTVNHELGHVLGGDHTESLGVLSGASRRVDVIDLPALESVCARLPCPALNPE